MVPRYSNFELECVLTRRLTASPLTCQLEASCLSDTSRNIHYCGLLDFDFPPTACMDSTAYVTACDNICRGGLSAKAW